MEAPTNAQKCILKTKNCPNMHSIPHNNGTCKIAAQNVKVFIPKCGNQIGYNVDKSFRMDTKGNSENDCKHKDNKDYSLHNNDDLINDQKLTEEFEIMKLNENKFKRLVKKENHLSGNDTSQNILNCNNITKGIIDLNQTSLDLSEKNFHSPSAINLSSSMQSINPNLYEPNLKLTLEYSPIQLASNKSQCTNVNTKLIPSSDKCLQQYPNLKSKYFLKSQSLDLVDNIISIESNKIDVDEEEYNENHQNIVSCHPSTVKSDNLENFSTITQYTTKRNIPKVQSFETRPIYPNVPYSPYASPYGSPRNHRKTPLRESRRISIERSGSFLQLNQYKLMDQIGQGSYGLVKLAYSEEDSIHYAMKILSKRKLLRKAGLMGRGPKKTTSPLDRVYREIAVLKKLDHPNVVKLVEVLDDPLEDSLYLVFELVQQGEVLNVPTEHPLSEERAWCVFRDCLLGLEYLHYQRIIHGDIKPGNLLLGEFGRVKIADLGVCNEFLGEDAAMNNVSTAGTPAFRAPETLIPGKHIYSGKAADIWALGATLYALVYGKVPFLASSVPALYEKIKNDELQFPSLPIISVDLLNLLKQQLEKDPMKRITLPNIKKHNWVTANGKCPLPSEDENCRLVQISDEDINTVVKSIPKLDTLILIKTMLKNHSFQNPFTRGVSGRAPQRGGSRFERFTRAGRSNSAPGAYNLCERQLSCDSILPVVSEGVATSSDQSFED